MHYHVTTAMYHQTHFTLRELTSPQCAGLSRGLIGEWQGAKKIIFLTTFRPLSLCEGRKNRDPENLGRGKSWKNSVGVCDQLPKTLTLFITKRCDSISSINQLFFYYVIIFVPYIVFMTWTKRRFSRKTYSVQRLIAKTIPCLWTKWPHSMPHLKPKRLKTLPFGDGHT